MLWCISQKLHIRISCYIHHLEVIVRQYELNLKTEDIIVVIKINFTDKTPYCKVYYKSNVYTTNHERRQYLNLVLPCKKLVVQK